MLGFEQFSEWLFVSKSEDNEMALSMQLINGGRSYLEVYKVNRIFCNSRIFMRMEIFAKFNNFLIGSEKREVKVACCLSCIIFKLCK